MTLQSSPIKINDWLQGRCIVAIRHRVARLRHPVLVLVLIIINTLADLMALLAIQRYARRRDILLKIVKQAVLLSGILINAGLVLRHWLIYLNQIIV